MRNKQTKKKSGSAPRTPGALLQRLKPSQAQLLGRASRRHAATANHVSQRSDTDAKRANKLCYMTPLDWFPKALKVGCSAAE